MWTDEQSKAIKAPVSDMLVTAAAGSGKTAVMVERVIERVVSENGTDIDKMLIVTFTKAAAAEIKERISARISKELDRGDSKRLKNQLVLINRASICTIHSFCLDIIKNNFHLLGLAPDFKIADSTQVSVLKGKAISDVLDEYYENEEDTDFYRVINSFTKKNDSAIEKIILDVYEFSQSMANPSQWLDMCERVYSDNCDEPLAYVLSCVKGDAQYLCGLLNQAIRLCGVDPAFDLCRSVLAEDLSKGEGIAKLCDEGWDRVYNYVKEYTFGKIASRKSMDPEIYEQIKDLRARARKILKSIIADKVNQSLQVIKEDLEYMSPCVSKICELVRAFDGKYTQYKREKNLLDFNDFEHLALKLLTDEKFSEVSDSLRARYDEIYVDEYQDCNGVQEAIFKAVSGEREGAPNMFMVGDMKQCIYRFRKAEPRLFKSKSDTYPLYDGEKKPYNKIILNRNFRSNEQIIDGVNKIFSSIMSERVGELEYTEEEQLVVGIDNKNDNEDMQYIDVDIIDTSGVYIANEAEVEREDNEKLAKIEAEAAHVAKKIHNMVKSGSYMVFDKEIKACRPVRYRDIVILLRSASTGAEYFADALSGYSIPSFTDTGMAFCESEEVTFLLNLLKTVHNPMDDIRLVSVMRSAVFRFTDNELLKIRTVRRDGYFYDSVQEYLCVGDALSSKLKSFVETLDQYREQSYIMDADEFLRFLIQKTGYMDYVSTLPSPELKKANIRLLLNKATRYVLSEGGSPFGFSQYVEKEITFGGGGDGAKIIGENEDVVRIMTIHKSKGLEFPVVFLSMCGKKFNLRDGSNPVVMHSELGIGINYVDEKKRFTYKPAVKNAISAKIIEENISEEMRLLYVALTRAREKLIMTGVTDNFSKLSINVEALCEGLERPGGVAVASCKTYLEWILCALYNGSSRGVCKAKSVSFRRNIVPFHDISVYSLGSDENKRAIPGKAKNSEFSGEICRRLEYEYPYSKLSQMPRNITVTELKRRLETDDDSTYRLYRMPVLKKPAFLSGEKTYDAAQIGTLMHYCMQKIELTTLKKGGTIKEQIDMLAEKGYITEQEASYVDIPAIEKFFCSEPGQRMLSAEQVYREASFEILVDSDEIFTGAGATEKIVVQGMIDAYFTDSEGNLVLVDYKTDRRKGASESEFEQQIIQRYGLQLEYYDKALRLLTGRGASKKYIYLFDCGKAIDIK